MLWVSLSTVPSPPLSLLPRDRGRLSCLRRHVELPTLADRPDEGAVKEGRVRENPPHPTLSPKSFAAKLPAHAMYNHANDSGERGLNPAVWPE